MHGGGSTVWMNWHCWRFRGKSIYPYYHRSNIIYRLKKVWLCTVRAVLVNFGCSELLLSHLYPYPTLLLSLPPTLYIRVWHIFILVLSLCSLCCLPWNPERKRHRCCSLANGGCSNRLALARRRRR